jgi:hypothetical protein
MTDHIQARMTFRKQLKRALRQTSQIKALPKKSDRHRQCSLGNLRHFLIAQGLCLVERFAKL